MIAYLLLQNAVQTGMTISKLTHIIDVTKAHGNNHWQANRSLSSSFNSNAHEQYRSRCVTLKLHNVAIIL